MKKIISTSMILTAFLFASEAKSQTVKEEDKKGTKTEVSSGDEGKQEIKAGTKSEGTIKQPKRKKSKAPKGASSLSGRRAKASDASGAGQEGDTQFSIGEEGVPMDKNKGVNPK